MERTPRFLAIIIFFIIVLNGVMGGAATVAEQALPIPPVLENTSKDPSRLEYEITIQKGMTEFFPGSPNITNGYNGSLLGPTIRAKRGQNVRIKVLNTLREYSTVHWHGMLVPGEMDGGPHQVIQPDSTWEASFRIHQPAATLWYHPHGIGNTAIQVYNGLAGLFILDDDISENLAIPKDYGENDIPLIVQDRRFSPEGYLMYGNFMQDMMQGMTGNTVIVNGAINVFREVPESVVRFRLLNGSNARVYNFTLSDKAPFYQIAGDGGFLEQPVRLASLWLSPGERAEILIDFSSYQKGQVLYLAGGGFKVVKFIVGYKPKQSFTIPKKLTSLERILPSEAKGRRFFELSGMGPMVAINGRQMNMRRIDEFVRLGDTEIWDVTSRIGMMGMMGGGNIVHNFHAHGTQFRILYRNGNPPPPNEQGWKDTFLLSDRERVQVIARFQDPGLFMYHCHILEHEDNGMMGQFQVE